MGNSLLAGLLGSTAFFGYYQLRYDVHELAQLVDDTRTSEGGPLQQVQHLSARPPAAAPIVPGAKGCLRQLVPASVARSCTICNLHVCCAPKKREQAWCGLCPPQGQCHSRLTQPRPGIAKKALVSAPACPLTA